MMKKQHKNYQDEDKKSAINKKINSQIKKPHLKMVPIKDKLIIYLKYIKYRIIIKENVKNQNLNNLE